MKIKWGVIGCGGIADRRTLPGMMLAENAELVAVMDTNPAAAEAVKEKYGAKYAFTTAEELLAVDEVEAVYIASPVICHREQAMAAAKAKKHILIEKPIALSVEEAEVIANACKENGVKLGVALMMRFHSYHQKIKEIIAEGKLGEIVSMRGQFTCWFPDMPNNWRQAKATAGGGAFMDMGVHCLDLLQYLSGLQVKEVAAISGTQIFDYEVEDAAGVVMRMNNGAIAYVDANFNLPDAGVVSKLEIYGTEGSIVASGTLGQVEGGTVQVTITGNQGAYNAQQDRKDPESYVMEAELGNMYTKEIEGFGKAILEDTEPPVPAEDGLYIQKIVAAAYQSNDTKTIVKIKKSCL